MNERESQPNPAGEPPVEANEVQGFALLERETVRRLVRGFDWRRIAAPLPRHRPAVPLAEATIGLVSTSGARPADQPRFARSRRYTGASHVLCR